MNKIDIQKLSIYSGSSIRDAMQAISLGEIGISLVLDKETQAFIRVLTDGDIRRALLDGLGLQSSIDSAPGYGRVTANINLAPEEINDLFSDQVRVLRSTDAIESSSRAAQRRTL